MSHVVTVKTDFLSVDKLSKVCQKRNLPIAVAAPGTFLKETLERVAPADNIVAAFKPDGWFNPVFVAQDGTAHFDNYGGIWGDIKHLEEVQRDYARETLLDKSSQQGWWVSNESVKENGEIHLTLEH